MIPAAPGRARRRRPPRAPRLAAAPHDPVAGRAVRASEFQVRSARNHHALAVGALQSSDDPLKPGP
eukprot:694328-Hanusia_phi.AAC.1